ncbi:aminoglycoside phosphotransferase [Chryseobacterium sp. Leaf404]|uniref:aminoglycoside phosphotransferase family protein n=1 Tax=unclassified Chryseobacterium TaxID=2593645 RepID=UPI0006FDAD7D|nr:MULTISPECIES: phosphotransferase [unclassified Chryseobacterium]KQT15563.1 aminoglycoside phosphotransferase [Chryseobacterium sp. Leaf404]
MTHEQAKYFFENHFGQTPHDFAILAQSGSARINFKASNSDGDYIVTFNENLRENESFLYFSEIFNSLHLNTPQIFAVSDDRKLYIQEFLGQKTFSEIIAGECQSERVKLLVKQTLEKLFTLQTATENKIDYSQTFEYESYDELPIMHDLYYFKNFVADVLDLEYHKSTLLKEFKKITKLIENLEPKGLMIRDFQARNIMVNDEDKVSFIDYQSAMKGPLMYDVISFLFQAKANFSEDFKNEMLHYYINQFKNEETEIQLKKSVKPLQLMRFLQVLGAYGLRGLVQRKSHFISSLEKGIQNITEFIENWEEMQNYPELCNVIKQLNSEKTRLKIGRILSN